MGASHQAPVRVLLLRHAHVDGHRGDVPITEEGHKQARRAGEWLTQHGLDVCAVLYGGTRRTRETAEGILTGTWGVGRLDPAPRLVRPAEPGSLPRW